MYGHSAIAMQTPQEVVGMLIDPCVQLWVIFTLRRLFDYCALFLTSPSLCCALK